MFGAKFHRELVDNVRALRRYATVLCGSSSDAEELVQDTLVKALENSHSWDSKRELRKWLFAIMHNAFVSKLRRRQTQQRVISLQTDAMRQHSEPNQLAHLELSETMQALYELPDEQKEAVILISLEGMNYEDAAKLLDIPIGTLMSRLARGREALRDATHRESRQRLRSVK